MDFLEKLYPYPTGLQMGDRKKNKIQEVPEPLSSWPHAENALTGELSV